MDRLGFSKVGHTGSEPQTFMLLYRRVCSVQWVQWVSGGGGLLEKFCIHFHSLLRCTLFPTAQMLTIQSAAEIRKC